MSRRGSVLTKPMKLSTDLADIVGTKEASRAECLKLLWAYLKKHNLQVISMKVLLLFLLLSKIESFYDFEHSTQF